MQGRTLRLSGALCLFVCATVRGSAQENEMPVLRVEFKCDRCGPRPEYTLELYTFRGGQRVDSADLTGDNTFTLRHVPYGDYQMAVTGPDGSTVYRQLLTVGLTTPPPIVEITARAQALPPGGGISVTQLQHPPARKALRAAVEAQKLAAAGNYEKAAAELEKAVRISPYFADAYVNLAAQHIHLGRYREAEQECKRALELSGPNPLLLTDLAAAQFGLARFADAEQNARAALRLEPGFGHAHLILGLVLAADRRTVREGLAHLEQAAATIPSAQAQVGKVRAAMAGAGMKP